jgi:hypothetical protein
MIILVVIIVLLLLIWALVEKAKKATATTIDEGNSNTGYPTPQYTYTDLSGYLNKTPPATTELPPADTYVPANVFTIAEAEKRAKAFHDGFNNPLRLLANASTIESKIDFTGINQYKANQINQAYTRLYGTDLNTDLNTAFGNTVYEWFINQITLIPRD